jgi:hypothetical protein
MWKKLMNYLRKQSEKRSIYSGLNSKATAIDVSLLMASIDLAQTMPTVTRKDGQGNSVNVTEAFMQSQLAQNIRRRGSSSPSMNLPSATDSNIYCFADTCGDRNTTEQRWIDTVFVGVQSRTRQLLTLNRVPTEFPWEVDILINTVDREDLQTLVDELMLLKRYDRAGWMTQLYIQLIQDVMSLTQELGTSTAPEEGSMKRDNVAVNVSMVRSMVVLTQLSYFRYLAFMPVPSRWMKIWMVLERVRMSGTDVDAVEMMTVMESVLELSSSRR